jgi:hypothetical protein
MRLLGTRLLSSLLAGLTVVACGASNGGKTPSRSYFEDDPSKPTSDAPSADMQTILEAHNLKR